jgi:hypothetical protein
MDLKIPFDTSWRSVAIAMSGGVDSTLLAYLICKNVPSNQLFTVHVINNIRCWKTRPWQQHTFDKVLQWFENQFQNITFKLHRNFVPPEMEHVYGTMIIDEYGKTVSGDTIELRSFAEFVCIKEDVDAYFNGVTKNPKNIEGMPARDLEPSEDNKHLEQMVHMGKLVYHPFRFVDKSQIVLKYKELGLNSLFDITRSCEGEFEGIDYKTYTPGQYVPTCGKCFWCKEREWAIEQAK